MTPGGGDLHVVGGDNSKGPDRSRGLRCRCARASAQPMSMAGCCSRSASACAPPRPCPPPRGRPRRDWQLGPEVTIAGRREVVGSVVVDDADVLPPYTVTEPVVNSSVLAAWPQAFQWTPTLRRRPTRIRRLNCASRRSCSDQCQRLRSAVTFVSAVSTSRVRSSAASVRPRPSQGRSRPSWIGDDLHRTTHSRRASTATGPALVVERDRRGRAEPGRRRSVTLNSPSRSWSSDGRSRP